MKRLNLRRWSALALAGALTGCSSGIFNPQGAVGVETKNLIIFAFALMLIVVIPVIFMTFYFAWKYRAGNKDAEYAPDWHHSNKIEFWMWAVPIILILILGTVTYKTTHDLDPFKPLESNVKPLRIQAISLNWKWLFVYPDQGIATINQIAFPKDTPLNFEITSQSVMNAFFIPELGSQIYAMPGMATKLHLIANNEGTFPGLSANYSGAGFSGMKFNAISTTQQGFEDWVKKVKANATQLDMASYKELAQPSENTPVTYYGTVQPDLFKAIIDQFMGHGGHMTMAGDAEKGDAHAGHGEAAPAQ
ncbi:ubiquinol oxidase subunit II [Amphibiibacter pelophylacis]|uniref:Ubiquinol oxidase subunit II n=1 Tax=Amphibiibacter pelophylacis TaxID=1799477 RepID=A0ACC6P412_9BURK